MENPNAAPAMTGRRLLPAVLAALIAVLLAGCGGGEDVAAVARDKGLVGATCAATGTPTALALNYSNRGWWAQTDYNLFNDFVFAGWTAVPPTGLYAEIRAFIQFNLGGFTGRVQSARLRIQLDGSMSPDASEAFSVWQVTTPAATVAADGNLTPYPGVFADLGDGKPYGAFTVPTGTVGGTFFDFPLADAALCDIQGAMGGVFSLGIRPDSLARISGTDEWARWGSSGTGIDQLILQMVP